MVSPLHCLSAAAIGVATTSAVSCCAPEKTSLAYRGNSDQLARLYDELIASPNLTDLTLQLTWTSCLAPDDPWFFNFQEGDRFPPLRNLTISEYHFEGENPRRIPRRYPQDTYLRRAQKIFSIFRSLPPAPSLEQWLGAMDFTRIERLRIDDNSYFWKRMKGELPSLRHLSTTVRRLSGSDFDGFVEFLQAIPPLESLHIHSKEPVVSSNSTLECSHFPLVPIFDHHSQSLKNLTLIQSESNVASHRRIACAPKQIAEIYSALPSLAHLGLDIDRHSNQWPNVTLDALVSNPHITSLHLRFEIGQNMNQELWSGWASHKRDVWKHLEPRINQSVAMALFDDLRAKKRGEPLQQLEVELADFPEHPYLGPIRSEPWVEGREAKWSCTVSERGATECVAWKQRTAWAWLDL